MKRFEKLSRANKIFLFSLPVAVLVGLGVLLASTNRFFRYNSLEPSPPPDNASGEYQKTDKTAIFNNKPLDYQMAELTPDVDMLEKEMILGETSEEKWIEVDLSEQKLYAHEGDRIKYEFLVSTGKWGRTPPGEYRIWIKLRYTKMSGGSKDDNTYYYLPNVPYTQYFYKGYGLHGTYWHQNFGQPMSHGCVNLSIPDAEKLFYWTAPTASRGKGVMRPTNADPGTRIVVHE